MHLDRYPLKAGSLLNTFMFTSEGKNGNINKVIQFQPMNIPGLFNLAFGDENILTGKFDDNVITDNGDTEKVLATVVAAIFAFSDYYPNAWIYATGSTQSRTRLYQMGINKYFDIAETDFEIMGEYFNVWEIYRKGRQYQAFAVHRKITKFES
jgi:hypothetical protein